VDAGHSYAVLLAALFAIAAGLVGSVTLMKRMVLASDVISHLALPGLGIAFLLKSNPLVGGGATLFLGTLLVWQLQKKTGLATDASIGVVFAAALGIGALITPQEDVLEALTDRLPSRIGSRHSGCQLPCSNEGSIDPGSFLSRTGCCHRSERCAPGPWVPARVQPHDTGRAAFYGSVTLKCLDHHSGRNGTPAYGQNGPTCGYRVCGELGLGRGGVSNQHVDVQHGDSRPDYRDRFRAPIFCEPA
jgi:hypothetical protein